MEKHYGAMFRTSDSPSMEPGLGLCAAASNHGQVPSSYVARVDEYMAVDSGGCLTFSWVVH